MMLRTTVSDEEFALYKAYADENCGGNVSAAIRNLLRSGIESKSTDEALEEVFARHIAPQFEGIEERLAKVTSRGTKASLGTNALCSTAVISQTELLLNISRNLEALMRANRVPYDDEATDMAMDPLRRFAGKLPAAVFTWTWDMGGRLQAMKGTPDYAAAVKDLRVAYRPNENL